MIKKIDLKTSSCWDEMVSCHCAFHWPTNSVNCIETKPFILKVKVQYEYIALSYFKRRKQFLGSTLGFS